MVDSLPKISIITPSYNQGHFIEETITSVLDQGYPNLEYIIIDGGSTDDSVEIIRKYEKYLSYWVSEKDKGQSDAINKGLKIATGEIINWLNSDDYYAPDALQHVAKQFANPTITCYCGISRIFGGSIDQCSNGTDIYLNNLAKTIGWARIDQPETFFRKSVIDKIGFLNETLHYTMDKDLWIRYLCLEGLEAIKKDKKKLVHFRHHQDSKTVKLKQKFAEETISLFYNYAKILGLEKRFEDLDLTGNLKPIPLKFYPAFDKVAEWNNVFDYFFLLRGLECYFENDYYGAKEAFSSICIDNLKTADKVEMEKVQSRMAWLPVGLKQIFNRLRG